MFQNVLSFTPLPVQMQTQNIQNIGCWVALLVKASHCGLLMCPTVSDQIQTTTVQTVSGSFCQLYCPGLSGFGSVCSLFSVILFCVVFWVILRYCLSCILSPVFSPAKAASKIIANLHSLSPKVMSDLDLVMILMSCYYLRIILFTTPSLMFGVVKFWENVSFWGILR